MSGAVLNTQGFGNRPESVEVPVISPGPPHISNLLYPIGKRWINSSDSSESVLTSLISSQGTTASTWLFLAGGNVYVASAGIAPPLVNGTITVDDPAVISTSVIFISAAIWNGNGAAYVTNVTNGSFEIAGGGSGATSTYYYMVIN